MHHIGTIKNHYHQYLKITRYIKETPETTCKYTKNTLQTVKWHRILQYVVPEHANNTYGEVEA
jgi:hypothetical protein